METKAVLMLAGIVMVSGCAELPETPSFGKDKGGQDKGLEIVEFKISDKTLAPGQQGVVALHLRNHHIEEINIEDLSLYNLGFLEVTEEGKSCTPSSIKRAKQGIKPEMECRWTVKAPPASELEDFESKSVTIKLNLDYSSKLSNSDEPFKLKFKPQEDINSRSTVKKTYSNAEVVMTVKAQQPAPSSGATLDFVVEKTGKGRVASDYTMSYRPESLLSDCPKKPEMVLEDKVEFSCSVKAERDTQVTRNLIFSTSYKYIKAPNLDIEVVNQNVGG